MSDELNQTAEAAVETPAEETAKSTEATDEESKPEGSGESGDESTDEAEESEEEINVSDPESPEGTPDVYQELEIGSPLILERFGYDIYIVNAKDEITLTNLRESGKTFGNIVSTVCTSNDQHDEVIVAVKR